MSYMAQPRIHYANVKQPKLYEFRFCTTIDFKRPKTEEHIGLVWGMTATEARRRIARHLKKCDGKLTNFQRIDYDTEVVVLGKWSL